MKLKMPTLETKDRRLQAKNKPCKGLLQWWLANYKAISAEFLATTMLLFYGCLGCLSAFGINSNHSAWGFALIILFLVETFSSISGAHFNPAITLLAVTLRRISIPLAIAYVIAQCSGAILGSYLVYLITPQQVPLRIYLTVPFLDYGIVNCVAIEALLTLVLGILCCIAWDPRNTKQQLVPVQICLAMGSLGMIGGPLTGGSMNPARSLGPAVIANNWYLHYVYWVGPIIGIFMAAMMYKIFMWFSNCHLSKKPVFIIGDDFV